MERAEFATGSVEVRGSGAVHRVLNFLGAFFLGIGPAARSEREEQNWWDRDPASSGSKVVSMTLGQQAELFDAAGQAVLAPAERAPSLRPGPAAVPETTSAAKAASRTIVSVHSKSRTTARVVATTRVAAATRVAAVAKTAASVRGAVGRQLVRSQSISSGREELRWFSVPQRALLPRFQLFEGADAVVEENGGLTIGSPSTRSQRGRVWFV